MKRSWVILAFIILLGILLRLFILSQRGSLWFDEAFSVHFAAMDLGQMWSYLKFENNPPLYFVLLHFWMKLFGTSELAVRALSMIFGVASIPLIYALGKRLHSTTAGLFAAFLLAISTFQVFYSTETRMYAMYLFLTLLVVWLFLKNQESETCLPTGKIRNYESGSRLLKSLIPYSLFIILVLLVWTHITAWLIVAALVAYLLGARVHPKRADRPFCGGRNFFIVVALAALSLLPWFVDFIRLKIASPLAQGWFFYIPPPRNFFLDMLEGFLVFGENNAFVITLLSVVIVILLWFAIRLPKAELLATKEHKAQLLSIRLLLCWLFVPLLAGFAFQNATPRYFIAVAPALYLLLGIGFARYREAQPPKLRRLSLLFPILVFALIFPDYPSLQQIGHHKWDRLAQWVEQQSTVNCELSTVNCLVLVNPHSEVLAFERYYTGALPVVGFYPREDNWDRDMRIVRTNWVSLVDEKNIRALANITAGYTLVFLITGETDPDAPRNLIPAWFWENGWKRNQAQEFGRISVMELQIH